MPQKLKEEVKDRIINAALDLMLEAGFNNADMRSIAKKADITHGNLYRYFKSKDDLISCITQPLIDSMNEVLTVQTGGTLKIYDENINDFIELESQNSSDEILENLADIVFENVRIFYIKGKQHPKAMKVVIQNKLIHNNIIDWLKTIGIKSFSNIYGLNDTSAENIFVVSVTLEGFVYGFFEGIAVILNNCLESDLDTFERIIKNYIHLQLQCLQFATLKQIETGNLVLKSEA